MVYSTGHHDVCKVLSSFIQEEKLLVAAVASMPILAALDSTSASSCLCSIEANAATSGMLQTQSLEEIKPHRSKI